MWAWMGILLAIALGYYFWKQNKAGSSSGASITPPGSSPDQTTAASQIPQFVNITDVGTQGTPPTTSPVGGPQPVNGVPNLIGMSHVSANAAAKNVGMMLHIDLGKGQKINAKKGYTVLSQNPPAGAQVQPGEKINVHLEETTNYDKQHRTDPVGRTGWQGAKHHARK